MSATPLGCPVHAAFEGAVMLTGSIALGAMRVARALVLQGHQVSCGGVRGVWERDKRLTKHERLLRLEAHVSERKIALTAEQVRLLERFSPQFRERRIETRVVDDLAAVDICMVGTTRAARSGAGSPIQRIQLDVASDRALPSVTIRQ